MKTTINRKELISYDACKSGLITFTEKHGDKTVNLSACFESNTLDDVFWLLEELASRELLSDSQKRDLRLYAADCAENVLHIFEKEYPKDDRPRLAIQATRDFVNGLIDKVALRAASAAANAAARGAARGAARAAANAAARGAARAGACEAARGAARAGARAGAEQSKRLKALFVFWEQGDES